MRKLIAFLQQDISVLGRQKQKKLPLVRQRKVIELFNNLFASGFHLGEIVDFLKRSQLLADLYTQVLSDGLLAGKPFSSLLADLRFSDAVVTQVALAEVHGNTSLSLSHIQSYLENVSKVRKKLIEVATYPIILLGFLFLIMLGLKNYLLPQLEEGNAATMLINHLPTIFLSLCGLSLVAVLAGMVWFRKTNKIKAFSRLAALPFFGKLIQIYLTAYYAREWGSLIVEYGQVKSKLGGELTVYAAECWEDFFSRVNRAMQLIQPLVFLFVALMVVLIYAAMLLPIYQNMEL
ncbi:type II secretion system F family protein [Streptococcus suis]|uniref:type II secretion system F family protein n=1 Tax=Streptococcus suis TaxID=1307 RepID=UPI0006B63906|nr:type II secretion system F family protein [Streptococcus suis]AML47434.1 competence protein CglB [Streptococcus suis]KPA60882.1 competence protein CglB [Streptococcus suis]MCH1720084.1 type II secretion system F family protein [Streptococcus suis]MCL4911505.1 type II secretion system F family protein [Streptococcus suis]NQK21952.1 type II secretion system F family protein [Streptococcus suis]